MLSFFRKKKIIPHIKLSGVIGNVGKFKQGIDFSGQEDIISKAFGLKKFISLRLFRHKLIIDWISFFEAFFTFLDFLNWFDLELKKLDINCAIIIRLWDKFKDLKLIFVGICNVYFA